MERDQYLSASHRHFGHPLLDDLVSRMPNPIRAIQVDGGSEFKSVFEAECQARGIKLFVYHPVTEVEWSRRKSQPDPYREFYEVTDSDFELADLRSKLLEWEKICNTYRLIKPGLPYSLGKSPKSQK